MNRGIAWNQNRAVDLAKGRYLMWIHHDDFMGKDYLGCCVEELEQDPGLILCYAQTEYIGASGEPTMRPEHEKYGFSDSPSQRFKELIQNKHQCEAMFGLTRTVGLRKTGLHGASPDRSLSCSASWRCMGVSR